MNPQRSRRRKKYLEGGIENISLFIENVYDPHNVAAILRSADGFGVRKVYVNYTYNELPDMTGMKASSGSATEWVDLERVEDSTSFTKSKKKEGFVFIAADPNDNAKNLTEFEFPEKCIIVLGSEKDGIAPEILDLCDERLFIPMTGMVRSYNVSVAAAVILYEIYKQKGKDLKLSKLRMLRGKDA